MTEAGDPLTEIESLRAELAREREARAALEVRLQRAQARTGDGPEPADLGLAQLQADAAADAAGPDAHIELTTWLAQASLAADAAAQHAREQAGLDQAALVQRLSAAPPPAPRAPAPPPAPPTDTTAIQAAEARARHHQNQVRRLSEELAAARAEQMRTAARLQALERRLPSAPMTAPEPEAPPAPSEAPAAGDTPAPFSLDTDWASALPELPTHETEAHDTPAAPTKNDTLLDAVLNFGAASPAGQEPRNPQRPEALEDHSADAAGDALADSAQAAVEAMDDASLAPGDAEAAGLSGLSEAGPEHEEPRADDPASGEAPAGESPFEEPDAPLPAGGAPTLDEVMSIYGEPSNAAEDDATTAEDPLEEWARSTQPPLPEHEPFAQHTADTDAETELESVQEPAPETPRWEQELPALQDDWPAEEAPASDDTAGEPEAPREHTIEQILIAWSRDPEQEAGASRAPEPPRPATPEARRHESGAAEGNRVKQGRQGKQGKDAMVDALLRFMGPKE